MTGIKIVGYAQIAVKTARTYGIKGSDSEIKERLNSYEGSVEAAAKILKDYLVEFRESIKNDKLGQGFVKSGLYSFKKSSILERQFQNSSKLSKRPRFDLRKGAFSAVTLQVAASNYPLQFFAMPSLPSFELLLKLPLEREDIVNLNVPQWLLNSMCAIWNSGIKVIYAKDQMGNNNYPNAYWHGMNSCVISNFLPKLVNE